MHVINENNYPVLGFLPLPCPWDHELFSSIWKRIDPKDTAKALASDPGILSMASNLHAAPAIHGLLQEPMPANVARWPFCAMPEAFFNKIGEDGFKTLLSVVTNIWTAPLPDTQTGTEIVKASTQDDAVISCQTDEFNDWIDSIGNDFLRKGTILRPEGAFVEKYIFFYNGGSRYEMSMAFQGTDILWAHINYAGFVSTSVDLTFMRRLAEMRRVSDEQAYLQENMTAILKYIYYKEHFALRPRKVKRGETIRERAGYEDFRVMADRCVIIDNKNNS